MKLVACDINELSKGFKTTSNLAILEEFADSDLKCVRVEGWTHKTAWSCQSSLNTSIKRYKKNMECRVINGEVYLVKK